jgi:hypothetical protein
MVIVHDQLAPRDLVVKTESGKLEVMTSAQRLPSQLRRLLIMIDGTRSVSQLEQMFALHKFKHLWHSFEAGGAPCKCTMPGTESGGSIE